MNRLTDWRVWAFGYRIRDEVSTRGYRSWTLEGYSAAWKVILRRRNLDVTPRMRSFP